MKKLLLALLFLASPVFAQTQTQYYTVPTIAALKAMTTSRPAVVQVVDSNPGIFNLSSGACSAADDIFQVQPTSGTTVCYTRMASSYAVGKNPTFNLPAPNGANDTTAIANAISAMSTGGGGIVSFEVGTYKTTGLTLPSNVVLQGAGLGVTTLQLIAGTTVNAVVQGTSAYTLFGTGSGSGIFNAGIRDMSIDANKSNGTTSDGVGIYGGVLNMSKVEIRNATGKCLWVEYGVGFNPTAQNTPQSWFTDVALQGCVDNFYFGGPNDSVLTGINSYLATRTNYWFYGAGSVKIDNCHGWSDAVGGPQAVVSIRLDSPFNIISNCAFEGATGAQMWVRTNNNLMTNNSWFYNQTAASLATSSVGIVIGDSGAWAPWVTSSAAVAINNRIAGEITNTGYAFNFLSDGGRNTIDVNGFSARNLAEQPYTGTPSCSLSQINILYPTVANANNGYWCNAYLAVRQSPTLYGNLSFLTPNSYPTISLGIGTSAGYASLLRLYDDGAAKTSLTSNSYGWGVDGSGNFNMTAGTSGVLNFLTNNTTRLSITTTGITASLPVTATSINKVAITAPATSATLTIANGKTLMASNTLTFTGTDSSSVAFGTGGTVRYTGSGTIALTELATQATNTVVGNATSGSASPTALAMTSCSTSSSAVTWTTNTGFGCNTSINAATLGSATFAAPGAIGSGTPSTGAFTTLSASSTITGATFAPGNNTNYTFFTASGFSAAWPIGIQGIYDGSGVDDYITFNTLLGSTATRATPTFTSSFPGSGIRRDVVNAKTMIFNNAAGTNVAPTYPLTVTDAGALTVLSTITATLASTSQTNVACYNSGTGLFTYQTWATGCLASSARFKENIAPKSNADALKVVTSLEPVKFQYKASANIDREWHNGFIAEQVVKVAPDLVDFEKDGKTPRAVKYQEMAPYFAGAIRELKAANDNLKAEIAELKKKMK